MSSVRVERTDRGVAVVTLSRPRNLNALDRETLAGLAEAFGQVGAAGALVLAGDGRLFCAGADLKEVRRMTSRGEFEGYLASMNAVVSALEAIEAPVIAAVRGGAFGGGLELLLATDLIVAAEEARLGLTEVRWGTIPGAGGTQRLARAVGARRARSMLLLGESLDAQTALEYGLVWRVVPEARVLATAMEVADRLAGGPRQAIRAVKALTVSAAASDLSEGLAAERRHILALFETPERLEGMAAFEDRREPEYSRNRP